MDFNKANRWDFVCKMGFFVNTTVRICSNTHTYYDFLDWHQRRSLWNACRSCIPLQWHELRHTYQSANGLCYTRFKHY